MTKITLENVFNSQDLPKERAVNKVAFFYFGFVEYCTYITLISATQDLLASTSIPSATIVIASNAPYFILSLILPCFISRLSFFWRIFLTVFSLVAGIGCVAVIEVKWVMFLGLVQLSLGFAFVDVGLLPLTVFYTETCFFAYSAGTGIGLFVGNLYYTGLTTWLCVPPVYTISSLLLFVLVYPIFYCLMDKDNISMDSEKRLQGIRYSLLKTASSHEEDPGLGENSQSPTTFSLREKIDIVKELLPLMMAFFIGITNEYLIVGGFSTTLVFASLSPRDHSMYYIISSVTGEIIARCYGIVLKFCSPKVDFVTDRNWVFTILLCLLSLFTFLLSWYRFASSVFVVIVDLFVAGLLSGALYINSLSCAGKEETVPERRQFSRAVVISSYAGGILVGCLLAIVLEPIMISHCLEKTPKQSCLTRYFETLAVNETSKSCSV